MAMTITGKILMGLPLFETDAADGIEQRGGLMDDVARKKGLVA